MYLTGADIAELIAAEQRARRGCYAPSVLREHELDRDTACAEYECNSTVWSCGACEAMICAECGVHTKAAGGARCICLWCAWLVAAVDLPKVQRRPMLRVVVLAAPSAAALSLLRQQVST